jgi:hypothetical protein
VHIQAEPRPPGRKEAEAILLIAHLVWNAVVYDTVQETTEWVEKVRSPVAGQPAVLAQIDSLIQRKRALYGHDLRVIGAYTLRIKRGVWHLKAEARTPGEKK